MRQAMKQSAISASERRCLSYEAAADGEAEQAICIDNVNDEDQWSDSGLIVSTLHQFLCEF